MNNGWPFDNDKIQNYDLCVNFILFMQMCHQYIFKLSFTITMVIALKSVFILQIIYVAYAILPML